MLAVQLAPAAFIGIFLAILVLIIVGAVLAHKAKKRRQLALGAWADLRGFSYSPAELTSLAGQFSMFKVLHTGSKRYAYNVMLGDPGGRGVWAFDYHYETYSTDSKGRRTTHHHHFSCVIVDSGLYLKPLSIRAENFFDKMKGAFGFDDIDFESAEFSRKFWVKAQDKRWAFDVLHQETIELLMNSARFTIEFDGPYAMAVRGKKFKPFEFDQALELVRGMLDKIPEDIAAELRG